MALYQDSRLNDYNTNGEFEPIKPGYDGAEAPKPTEHEQDSKLMASVPGSVHVEAVRSQSSTSPLTPQRPLHSKSPGRTRRFFREKVQEVVRRTRYGQWDFDFSPRSAYSDGDDGNSPPLTVPPWGPVSAKEIFTGILRPAYEDPGWKHTGPKGVSEESPRSSPTCAE